MRKLNKKHIWIFLLLLLVVFRDFNGSLVTEGAVISLAVAVLMLFWFIVPYVFGDDMPLPGYPNTKFKKGRDDIIRLMFFLLGVVTYLVCFVA